MSFIIGRGRYARQVYPERSAGIGGVIQEGYDQVIDEGVDLVIPPSGGAFFPRDLAANPLRVTLPAVQPGNILEVDFRACLEKDNAYYYIQNEFGIVAFVTFDGNPPVLAPSATVFTIQKSTTGHREAAVTVEGASQPIFNITTLASVVIPAGAVSAIVQLVYAASGAVITTGVIDEHPFATLKCSELSAIGVVPPVPGVLVPTL